MDFNAIYKLNEADNLAKASETTPAAPVTEPAPTATPAPAQVEEDGLPQDVHASEEALNIAMNQLQLIVKNFKEDNYIQQMMDFYDGKSVKESVEANNNAEHLTEAKKGSFKSYYNQIVKSLSNTQKKIKIAAMILIATAIVAGVGVGTVLIKKLVNGKKALKASNALANSINPATLGAVKQNVVPNTNATSTGQGVAQPAAQNVQPEVVQQQLKPADQQIVSSVINGKYGNAPERTENLIKAGYDPVSVQNAVNASEAAKTVPNAVEPTPAPAEVKQTVEKALDSGELEVSNTGEVKVEAPQTTNAQQPTEPAPASEPASAPQTTQSTVDTVNPTVAPTTQDVSSTPINNPVQNVAPQPTITSNNAAYESWKANPNNQKMLNNLTLQARAAGQDPEAVMKDVFNNGGSVDALRTIEAKYGLSDISGNGVTDRGMLRSINTANLNSWKNQQYQQLQSDPEVQAYLNFISQDRQLAGKSLADIGSKATGFNSYTGLYEWSTNNNQSVWTQKPGVTAQIKNGLSKIQKIARTNKLPN